MNQNLVVVPLIGQEPLIEKMLTAILADHGEKTKHVCADARCWVNAYHCAIVQLAQIRPEAGYGIVN